MMRYIVTATYSLPPEALAAGARRKVEEIRKARIVDTRYLGDSQQRDVCWLYQRRVPAYRLAREIEGVMKRSRIEGRVRVEEEGSAT